jgi:hypothetical protein
MEHQSGSKHKALRFCAGALAVAGWLVAGSKAVAAGPGENAGGTLATVHVDVDHSGKTVPSDFDGFSIEVDDAARMYLGRAGAPNLVFYQLLKNLGVGTIRIGGDSVDYSCWDPSSAPHPSRCRFTITEPDIQGFFHASAATGWGLIVGVNLAQNGRTWALEYGKAVVRASESVPGSNLIGFEFGNEPDLFSTETRARPKGYSWKGLVEDWRSYVKAFKSDPVTRNVPLVGPAFDDASPAWKDSWLPPFITGVGPENFGIITVHEYPTDTCNGDTVTIPQLLSEPLMAQYHARAAAWIATAGQAGLPLELGETNSSACAGRRGVNDTFASAAWGLDWLFTNVQLGFRRINFHMDSAAYSAVFVKPTKSVGRTIYTNHVSPLYYAMLAFDSNAEGKSLLTASLETRANVKAYAVRSPGGPVTVFVINKDLKAAGTVLVQPSRKLGEGSLLLVRAESLASKSVSYGGQSFNDATGQLRTPATTAVPPNSQGEYTFDLPQAAFAVLTINP